LRTTRRIFLLGVSSLVLVAAVTGAPFAGRVLADDFPMADLMQAGPLGDQAVGQDNAPVTIIEYASLTCSHCAHFAETTFPELKKKYIDTGKVRFIFREFPFDPVAAGAFMLARCAPKDKYFPLIELLFENQNHWAVEKPLQPLLVIAKQVGFTEDTFKACLANQKVLDGIEWVRNRAADKFKVDATPTFFVNGQKVPGAISIDEFDKIIEPYLKS
jgi:protein-disulfide isomerase